ncbi:VTT domain-containing protein [Cohnella sp. CBP 2801]|uniref:VTT domain-containing protein n=2 Tax=Cohnella zeiphila TaxID=2761120 RepID=A0A7X0VZM2_9BACL|nr:VTT domain-containing protein [Cohnella zeiphila]
MVDAILFPIPAFFLQVSLSALNPDNALWLATLGFAGCMIGTPIGYAIGRTSGYRLLRRFVKQEKLDRVESLFRKHGEMAILIGSFTPIPFKLFTVASGCTNFPLRKLMLYAAIGRAAKFYIVGLLFYAYGRSAEHMVHGKTLTFIMLAAGALLATVWLLMRVRRKRLNARPNAASKPEDLCP